MTMPAARRARPDPPKPELERFINELHALVEHALRDPDLFAEHYPRIQAAWQEVEPRFDEIQKELANPRITEKMLTDHGLTGAQLELKLAIFDATRNEYLIESERHTDAERFWSAWLARVRGLPGTSLVRAAFRRVRRAGQSAVKGRLWRALRSADTVLGSIGNAVPAGGAPVAAVGEFKQMVEVLCGGGDEEELGSAYRIQH
jgi:hypothetical protein